MLGADEFDIEGTIRAFGKAVSILGDHISKWYEDPKSRRGLESRFVLVKSFHA